MNKKVEIEKFDPANLRKTMNYWLVYRGIALRDLISWVDYTGLINKNKTMVYPK
ncbi:hypothetical protein QQ008_14320 [Fulvivirgaceae bacterium BMA10]|uniref:Uncharacterized protein n=1 Tax=Splendidivirga corallicola TaxID=3051826 RepID=A0ABT8KQT3_9BACT|nr:hypothetical protein [Fulvivirgaceae bacterium BMA10]